jgi:hypothetical protein
VIEMGVMGVAPSVETAAAFADLVYSDSEWLRAEFEALMTAGFGTPPRFPRPVASDRTPPYGEDWPALPAQPQVTAYGRPIVRSLLLRQRSPPPEA